MRRICATWRNRSLGDVTTLMDPTVVNMISGSWTRNADSEDDETTDFWSDVGLLISI